MKSGKIIDLRNRRPNSNRAPSREESARSASQIQPRRSSPLRARRRNLRLIIFSILVALLAAIGYGIHYVSYLPVLTIQKIEVRGAEQITPESVRAYVESDLHHDSFRYIAKNNVFFYPKVKIQAGIIANFPHVKTVQISRASLLSTTVDVALVERSAFARWCAQAAQVEVADTEIEVFSENCYLMDETGFIFSPATPSSARPTHAYIFRGDITGDPVGKTYKPGNLPGLLALLRLLEGAGYMPQGLTIQDDRDFQVPLAAGFYLKGSFGGHPDVMVKNLQLILLSDALKGKESEIEYVDLRFGNRVYYKLKGETEVEPEVAA